MEPKPLRYNEELTSPESAFVRVRGGEKTTKKVKCDVIKGKYGDVKCQCLH